MEFRNLDDVLADADIHAMSDGEIIQEFLVESGENLDRLDRDLVNLEKNPHDQGALGGIFRTIHSIKGTCGFLGFSKLEKVAHVGENLLTRLRDGQLVLNPEITTALLSMVDAVRQMLSEIQTSGRDGESDYPELRETLTRLQGGAAAAGAAAVSPPAPPSREPAVATKAENPKPAAEPSTRPAAEQKPRETAGETIRVAVNLLDKLMTLVGELVLARNQLLQFSTTIESTGLHAISQRMDLIASELQEEVMKTRMQPIGNIWNQFPRTVRDVALGCGKQVNIEMEGKETELDKTIIEAIKDPLTHLVRNSVDHGIESPAARVKAGKSASGLLTLRAFHEGGQVNIEISDDGGGLNCERIRQKAIDRKLITVEQSLRMADREVANLIFLPGFSTAEKVTNVSGRGVGMDVVRTNVEKIGGVVDVQSEPGRGTTVRIKIPLTLAIIPALVVNCCGERYAIPQVNLLELVRHDGEMPGKAVEMVHGVPVYRLRGRLLPLVYLARELRMQSKGAPAGSSAINIVVLQADERQFGLVVDGISDTEEIVVKPLRKQLKTVKTFAGSSIMGDGRVALILDVLGLAQRASIVNESRERATAEKTLDLSDGLRMKQTFLVFAGPGESRMAIPLSALDRLEEFPVSQIETSGTEWVTQYRGQILTLIRLDVVMEERRRKLRGLQTLLIPGSGPVQALVLTHEGRRFGLVVSRIIDIVEDHAEVKTAATRACVLYSVVIADRVTELLDVPAIVRSADRGRATPRLSANVLGESK